MPITNRDEALKEFEEIKERLLSLERQRKEIATEIKSLEDYLESLEEKWGIGFYG